jgi:hypothetical protein
MQTRIRGTSRCGGGGFAKQVAGNVEKGKAPTLLWEHVEIRLDENLDGLFAGINLDTNRRVAKVDLMARPFAPRMMAWGIIVSLSGVGGDIRPPSTGPGPKSRAIMVWNGAGRWINVGNRSDPASIT